MSSSWSRSGMPRCRSRCCASTRRRRRDFNADFFWVRWPPGVMHDDTHDMRLLADRARQWRCAAKRLAIDGERHRRPTRVTLVPALDSTAVEIVRGRRRILRQGCQWCKAWGLAKTPLRRRDTEPFEQALWPRASTHSPVASIANSPHSVAPASQARGC